MWKPIGSISVASSHEKRTFIGAVCDKSHNFAPVFSPVIPIIIHHHHHTVVIKIFIIMPSFFNYYFIIILQRASVLV